ncbi:MAG: HNH endonuclease [Bifidobacteriaceae bacterium]|nr:HNH endonuclease [Bifidobacteriaceae bacterium]
MCHLCGEPVEFGLRPHHPRGPSMDHVAPRSHGGSWDLANLLPAHFGCNSSRGNSQLTEEEDAHSQEW